MAPCGTPQPLRPTLDLTCWRIRETTGELCWSNTLERISSPDRTLSTSLQGRGADGHQPASQPWGREPPWRPCPSLWAKLASHSQPHQGPARVLQGAVPCYPGAHRCSREQAPWGQPLLGSEIPIAPCLLVVAPTPSTPWQRQPRRGGDQRLRCSLSHRGAPGSRPGSYLCSLLQEVTRVLLRWGRLLAPALTASRSRV